MSWGGPKKVAPKASPYSKPDVVPKITPGVRPTIVPVQSKQKAQDDLQQKREAAQAKRVQATAALHVRKVIQRVRIADTSNFDTLCEELENAQLEKLEDMGPMAETIREEAERALQQARERIEKQIKAEQEKEQAKIDEEVRKAERIAQQEAKRQAEEERLKELTRAVRDSVETIEMLAEAASEAAKPFMTDAVKDSTPEEILKAAALTEEAAKEAQGKLTQAMKEVPEKKKELGKQANEEEFKEYKEKLKNTSALLAKLRNGLKEARARANRRVSIETKEESLKADFKKLDKDCDGKLNRAEVASFALEKYDVTASEDFLNRVFKRCPKEGAPYEKFRWLRSLVAIEKSVIKARAKRAEEEEAMRLKKEEEARKAAEREQIKAEVKKIIEDVKASVDAVKEKVAKGKDVVKGLKEAPPESVEETQKLAHDAIADATAAKASLESSEKALASSFSDAADVEDKSLSDFKKKAVAAEKRRIETLGSDLKKILEWARQAEGKALRRMYKEREPIRFEVALCISDVLAKKAVTADELFKKAAGSTGKLGREGFTAFLRSLPDELGGEDDEAFPAALRGDAFDASVDSVFRNVAGDEGEAISLEAFSELLTKAYYRVVKSTVLTDDQTVNSKGSRRLEEGALLHALSCAKVDANTGVKRVRCRLLRAVGPEAETEDAAGSEGWATVAGNKGTVFLTPCTRFLACVKEAVMSDELAAESKLVRRVATGEVLEVLEWDKKDPNGMTRLRCKATSDGMTGWVSLATSKGTTFLEPC